MLFLSSALWTACEQGRGASLSTPEETFKSICSAAGSKNWIQLFKLIDPEDRKSLTLAVLAICRSADSSKKDLQPIFDRHQVDPEEAKRVAERIEFGVWGGAQADYRIWADGGFVDPAKQDRDLGILRSRLKLQELKEGKIFRAGPDLLRFSVPGIDGEIWRNYKRIIGQFGKLELMYICEEETQRRFRETSRMPDGAIELSSATETDPSLLVMIPPIISGECFQAAVAQKAKGEGGEWEVGFTLQDSANRAFEEATDRSSKSSTKIAIVLDGKIVSSPVVRSKISRTGLITGKFSENGAKELAAILTCGHLTYPIGRIDPSNGKFIPGEPEHEEFVGPLVRHQGVLTLVHDFLRQDPCPLPWPKSYLERTTDLGSLFSDLMTYLDHLERNLVKLGPPFTGSLQELQIQGTKAKAKVTIGSASRLVYFVNRDGQWYLMFVR